MACTYTYRGVNYTKEQLLERLSIDLYKDLNNENVFRSISTKPKKQSNILSESVLMLNQRYADAKNMLQAIKNSSDTKEEKLRKTAYYKNIMEQTRLSRKELIETPSDKQLDYVLDKALGDAKLVDSLFNSSTLSYSELRFANNIVETWSHLNNGLGVDTIYDIADEDFVDILEEYIEKTLGWNNVILAHINDSKDLLNSKKNYVKNMITGAAKVNNVIIGFNY